MSTSNAICNSFKAEILNGGHVFDGPVTPLITISNGAYTTNSVSSMSGVVVGMGVSGTGIANGSVIAATTTTGFTLSLPTTAPITASTVTISADQFYFALITANPSGTYGANTTNYSQLGSDEVSGPGYTAGGVLMVNMSATLSGNTAILTFGANPSFPVSTFSYSAGLLYNASQRIAGVSGRAVAVFDFGGNQSVTNGIPQIVLPAYTASTSLIRIQ